MSEFDDAELIERIRDLTGREFEAFVASLWELQGWTTEITAESRDGGRDIIAQRQLPYEETIKIEAKGWGKGSSVSGPTIRQYALLPGDDVDNAVVVTSSSFTGPANRTAAKHDIKLVDGSRLVRLVRELGAEKLVTDDVPVSDWECVKSGNHLDWTADHIGEENSVTTIPGVGKTRAEQLDAVGIHTPGDLLSTDIEQLVEQISFAESRLERWRNLAAFYKESEHLTVIDGVDQSAVTQLAEADIYTVADLQAACPKELADQTDLTEETLKIWIGDAVRRDSTQVTELPKIGAERGKELATVGILTVRDLAAADPEDIANRSDIGKPLLRERIEHVRSTQS